jgi:hypothetical protein
LSDHLRPESAITFDRNTQADAADPTLLGASGGFLLGNGYRCHVPAGRVLHAGEVIRGMIRAAVQNVGEEEVANAGFASAFFSSAYPNADTVMPPCEAVVAQFERLERHHREAGFSE